MELLYTHARTEWQSQAGSTLVFFFLANCNEGGCEMNITAPTGAVYRSVKLPVVV